jgi:hypothetical protein
VNAEAREPRRCRIPVKSLETPPESSFYRMVNSTLLFDVLSSSALCDLNVIPMNISAGEGYQDSIA